MTDQTQTTTEPAAWRWRIPGMLSWNVSLTADVRIEGAIVEPLYTTPQPLAVGLDREAVARVIDPEIWSDWDIASHVIKGLHHEEFSGKFDVAASLAKADAILALAAPAEGYVLPEVMTPEMERVWRGAFIEQGYKRRGRGAIGNTRRLKHPESCEQAAWKALRKHMIAACLPAAPTGETGA